MTPLRQRMLDELQLRNYSRKTVDAYVGVVSRFALHFGKSPAVLGAEEVRQYLLHLVQERKVAWGTYKQALSALRFLYRQVLQQGEIVQDIRCPRPERRLPVVLSVAEVSRFFAAIPSYKHRMILMTAYSAGLRIAEVVHLKVSDIDSQRMVLRVEQGKRRKDRYTLAGAADDAAALLVGRAAAGVFVSGAVAGAADVDQHGAERLPASSGAGRHRQAHHATHAAT
jgi:site-specific recombinase XerD